MEFHGGWIKQIFKTVTDTLHYQTEMLEARRKELEDEFERVEDRAKARQDRVRERGTQVVPAAEQDEELEELEAEIEMYAIALGEDKDEDFLSHSADNGHQPPKKETAENSTEEAVE